MARTMGNDDQATAAKKSGVNASTVSRWLKDDDAGRRAESVISFARAYAVSPLKALVEAGLLEASEARTRPAADPDYSQLANDELLELVRARMREEVMGNAEHPAATTERHLKSARTVARKSKADDARDKQDRDAGL